MSALRKRAARALTAPTLALHAPMEVVERFRDDTDWHLHAWELPAWSRAVLDLAEVELDWDAALSPETWQDRLATTDESTADRERATEKESTIGVERAEVKKSTKLRERAEPEESTKFTERAAIAEGAAGTERAVVTEGAEQEERAVLRERAEIRERAAEVESTVTPKRAAVDEGTRKVERAAHPVSTMTWERERLAADADALPGARDRHRAGSASAFPAVPLESTDYGERAATSGSTGQTERAVPRESTVPFEPYGEPPCASAPQQRSEPIRQRAPGEASEPRDTRAPRWTSEPNKKSAPTATSEPGNPRAPEAASEPPRRRAPTYLSVPLDPVFLAAVTKARRDRGTKATTRVDVPAHMREGHPVGAYSYIRHWQPKFGSALVNPEYAARVRAKRTDVREPWASRNAAAMREMYAHADVSIRLKPERVPAVLASGRYEGRERPTDETLEKRENQELAVWGEHPVYGYLSTADEVMRGPMQMYGDAKLVLHPHVRQRATVTLGDSLHGIVDDNVLPDPVDNPSAYSIRPQSRDPTFRDSVNPMRGVRGFLVDGYVEVQILGGVGVDDIAYARFMAEPPPDVKEALRAAGIPWAVGKQQPSHKARRPEFIEREHPRYPPGHPLAGRFMSKPDAEEYLRGRTRARARAEQAPRPKPRAPKPPLSRTRKPRAPRAAPATPPPSGPDPREHFTHLPHLSFRHDVDPPKRAYKPPPPPRGKRGERKAGGFAGNGATNTKIGDLGEAMVEELDFTSVLPPGRRQNPLDVLWDDSRWGFEVKVSTTHAQQYKVAMKKGELEEKRAYAEERGLRAATMIVVLDPDNGTADAYWREGIHNGHLNERDWAYAGSVSLAEMQARQTAAA